MRTSECAVGGSLRPRANGLVDYTRWFLKIGPYVYKCIILGRRKVVWRLELQLFSRK